LGQESKDCPLHLCWGSLLKRLLTQCQWR
jgi:hypothetical protein